MKRLFLIISAILPLLFVFSGCDKFKGDTGPAGPSLSGELVGFAFMYDNNGVRKSDNSGITVTLEGHNLQTTTNADGRWSLPGMRSGTYTIAFSKAGYGTRKSVGYQFVGGGQVYYGSAPLYPIPSFTVTGFTGYASSGYIYASGNFSGTLPSTTRPYKVFVGLTPNVSADPSTYLYVYSGSTSSSSFSVSLYTSSLNSYGITAGQTVYLVAYTDGYSTSSYIDFTTGRYFYPGINPTPSSIVNVVVPS